VDLGLLSGQGKRKGFWTLARTNCRINKTRSLYRTSLSICHTHHSFLFLFAYGLVMIVLKYPCLPINFFLLTFVYLIMGCACNAEYPRHSLVHVEWSVLFVVIAHPMTLATNPRRRDLLSKTRKKVRGWRASHLILLGKVRQRCN
jgi:hypothetical protein